MKQGSPNFSIGLLACFAGILLFVSSCTKKDPPPRKLSVTTIASGLNQPIGLEVDNHGRVWVAESGSGKNDGKVSVILPDGKKFDAITGFESVISPGGESEGPSHLLFADGMLYILGAHAKMYKVAETKLNPGYTVLKASALDVEDIGKFVLSKKFAESHPYNLTVGPNGNIYITDAAANAILRHEKSGALGIVATLSQVENPLPVGPPKIDAVPTGILYDGQNFLVTTLVGFPFPPGKASILKITPAGAISTYQTGFTSLVDIAAGGTLGRLVLEHGVFGQMGFTPKTGRLVWATGNSITPLAEGLNQPAGLKQANDHTWYVTAFGDGTVLKVTY